MKRKAAVFLFSLCIIFVSSNVFAAGAEAETENVYPEIGDSYAGVILDGGVAGITSDGDGVKKKQNIYFSLGFNYTKFMGSWTFVEYGIQYKRYRVLNNTSAEHYDYISPCMGLGFKLNKFLISFIVSYNHNLNTGENKKSSRIGIGMALGCFIYSNSKILIPLRFEFEYLTPAMSSDKNSFTAHI